MEMRGEDTRLARQLIDVRRQVYQFKLERSCDEHKEMLDDVQDELEALVEQDKIADLVEIPLERVMAMPLLLRARQHGITRLVNLLCNPQQVITHPQHLLWFCGLNLVFATDDGLLTQTEHNSMKAQSGLKSSKIIGILNVLYLYYFSPKHYYAFHCVT